MGEGEADQLKLDYKILFNKQHLAFLYYSNVILLQNIFSQTTALLLMAMVINSCLIFANSNTRLLQGFLNI